MPDLLEPPVKEPAPAGLLTYLEAPNGWEEFNKLVPQEPHPVYPTVGLEHIKAKLLAGATEQEILDLIAARTLMIAQERIEPILYGWEPDMWKQADAWWSQGREMLILGSNRCLGGETKVYDPVLGIQRRIDSIHGAHHVLAWDGKELVIAEAEEPFEKGLAQLYRVELSNGQWFVAAGSHRVLALSGRFCEISELKPGFALFLPESTSDISQPVHALNGPRCSETESGSPADYHRGFDLCDEQPPHGPGSVQDVSPSQGDVPTHTLACDNTFHWPWQLGVHSVLCNLGVLGSKSSHNPLDRLRVLHAIQDDPTQTSVQNAGIQFQVACMPWSQSEGAWAYQAFGSLSGQTPLECHHRRSIFAVPQRAIRCGSNQAYVLSVTKERIDVKWDMTVPTYGNYLCAGIIHHNSGKTSYGANRVVKQLMDKPGAIVWCFSTSFETSVRDQMKAVYHMLPRAWRVQRRSRVASLNYSQKRGFTEKLFVTPTGAECRFMNYQQDAEVIEGGQVDLWWADELIPADWVITLRSRCIDRRGRGLVTQTPIKGYTQTVAEYLNGAKTLEWADCDLLPNQVHWPGGKKGRVPLKMSCLNPNLRVYFFHSKNNPYVPYEDLIDAWKDKGSANILCRLYGVTSGVSNCKFPRFGPHNIIAHEKIPQKGTNYHVVDFSWNKPWCMLWARVQRVGDKRFIYIYREWPDLDNYGEWVVRSEKPDGAPGPAQQPCGYGINDYKRLILEHEKIKGDDRHGTQEIIFARYGDPRSGSATALADEGATTIFQMLEENKENSPSMIVEPVAGHEGSHHILEGVNLVNTWLEYDVDKPISPLNCPQLYISDRCQNTIECLKTWTGAQGLNGASKDFIDLLRYLAMMDVDDVANQNPVLYEGGAY